ncbi:hypothetical protein SAMN05444172_9049 [Burkholderia sp. GAS332]|nr:hypothetical protein SAMN05444172_9049 [Burkholderia sp. GAS332]
MSDFSGSREVSFVSNATSGFLQRIQPALADTFPGTQDAASVIRGLVQQAGFAFVNHGVTAKFIGQYLGGTIMGRIERVAGATQMIVLLDQQVIYIWPNGGGPHFPAITLSPDPGIAGYPTSTPTGIEVRCEWNLEVLFGTKAIVPSMVAMASCEWREQRANHELSRLTPDGVWVGGLNLCPPRYLSVNPN